MEVSLPGLKCLDNCLQDSSLVVDFQENSRFFVGRLSAQRREISEDATEIDSCSLAALLRLLVIRELFELLFPFYSQTSFLSWKKKRCFVMFTL